MWNKWEYHDDICSTGKAIARKSQSARNNLVKEKYTLASNGGWKHREGNKYINKQVNLFRYLRAEMHNRKT